VENTERSGRPRTHRTDENVEKMRNMLRSGRRLSIRNVFLQQNYKEKGETNFIK
jgi:hypothetical protein